MLLICKNCMTEYESPKSNRQYCSKSCSVNHRKNDITYIQKLRKKKTARQKETKKCHYCNAEFLGDTYRKYCSTDCCNKDRLLNKGYLLNIPCKECNKEFKPVRSTAQFCSAVCARRNKINNPEFLSKLSAGCQKRSQNPEYLKRLSEAAIARWEDTAFRDKMNNIFSSDEWIEKCSESYLTYDYVFPSGRIERVQGYEGKALDFLLQEHTEEDIIVNKKKIRERIGVITYVDSNHSVRRYIPDIYVPSKNLVVEVKSEWTFEVQRETNEKKKHACISKGINFEFMIL